MKLVAKTIALSALLCTWAPSVSDAFQNTDSPDDQRVLEYLDQRGLNRLAILQLSNQLATELDGSRRNEIAQDLADRYRKYFFSDFDEDTASSFFERVTWLSSNYPAVNTPNFRLALSHAEYIQAERQFRRWWSLSAPASGRQPIVDQFEKLHQQIAAQIRTDESRQEQLISQIALDSTTRNQQQRVIDEIEVRLLHGHYLFAWTSYFLSVMSPGNSSPLVRQAETSFFRALRIEQPGPIEKIDDKWLDFSAPIAGRALLGLAAVYQAMDRDASVRFCFDKAEAIAAPRFNRPVMKFNALAFSGKWEEAVQLAKRESNNSLLPVSFWSAVANAGFSTDRELPELRALQQSGLLGIARKFEFEQLRKFVVTEEIDFPAESYQKKWIEALVQYHISVSSNLELDSPLQQINELLVSNAEILSSDLARIRCIAALMHYKRGEFENANRQIRNVDDSDVQGDRQLAERIDWLNVLIQLKRASLDTRRQAGAIGAVNRFVDRHPDSPMYQLALFERFKLANRLLPSDQALKKFQDVANDHPFFSQAQFEIVDCLRRCWSEQTAVDGRSQIFDRLLIADQTFRALPDVDERRKLDSLLIVIDVALRSNKDPELTSEALSQAEVILAGIAEKKPQQYVIQYFRFRQARKTGDMQTANDLAHTLAIQSEIKQHRLVALAFIADLYDQESQTKFEISKTEVYEMLVNEFGSSVEKLRQSKNARVAATRLVESYLESKTAGDKAKELNDKLLSISSNQENLLLNSARISMLLGDPDSALEVWRKIVQSAKPGDDLWFESKLGIVKCLAGSNRENAAKVLKQTASLAGKIPDRWTLEFEKLNNELHRDSPNR